MVCMSRGTGHLRYTSTGRLVALVLWLLFIWANSCVPGEASSSESLAFLQLVRPVFEALGVSDVNLMHTIVRKAAHFTEYLVLGVLAARAFGLSPVLAVVLVGVCAPSVDETIQLFVPGRVGAVTDVLIDMTGYTTGSALVALVSHRRTEATN